MKRANSDVTFLLGIVAGAIVGGIVAALFVPRSGTETREQIIERGLELKSQAEDVVDRAQRIANEAVAKVQTSAQDLIKQVQNGNSAQSA
mgnify:CR=1 FL=1